MSDTTVPDAYVVIEHAIAGLMPYTTAIPLCDRDDRPRWMELRRQGIGASEMAIVLGRSTFMSPFALYHAKLGGWETTQTEDMDIGQREEPVIAALFADEHTDLWIDTPRAGLYCHPVWKWAMCTPDIIAVDKSTVEFYPVELKTDESGRGWGVPGSDEVPEQYRIQLMMQMGILGAKRGFLARLGRRVKGRRYASYVVDFDDEEFNSYLDAGAMFMHSLASRDEPPIDEYRSTLNALERLYSNVDPEEIVTVDRVTRNLWLSAREELADAKRRVAFADNALRLALGTAGQGMDPDGNIFVRRSVRKRDGHVVGPHTVDELRRQGGQQSKVDDLHEGPEDPDEASATSTDTEVR